MFVVGRDLDKGDLIGPGEVLVNGMEHPTYMSLT